MRKVLLALLLAAFCLSLYAFMHQKRIRRQNNLNLASVSAIFPVDQNGVTKAIIKMFREGKPPPTGKFSHFSLAQVGEEQFPADYQLSHYQKNGFELIRGADSVRDWGIIADKHSKASRG